MQMAETARALPVRRLHPGPIRVMHWINAIMILIMIGSGFKIYENQPIFSWIRFPSFLLIGGDPEVAFKYNSDPGFGGALQWHFMAMWFVVINGLAYLTYGFATGRLHRKMLPIKPGDVLETIREALRFRLSHDDITVYNAVQKLLYIGIILVVIVQVTSGLAIWKPVQFSSLIYLFRNFETAKVVHFLGMSAICLFLAVHVTLALVAPRTFLAMITGGPPVSDPPRTPAVATPNAQLGE